jgi:uncharacterized protein YjaZ
MQYLQKTLKQMKLQLYILGDDGDMSGDEVAEYVRNINAISGGWLGFGSSSEAEAYLNGVTFDEVPYLSVNLDFDKISHVIESVLEQIQNTLPLEEVDVVVTPSINPIVIEKFKGVTGYTSSEKTILLNVAHDNAYELKELQARLAQMYSHLFLQNQWNTLLDSIINEGWAIHYAQHIVSGYVHPYQRCITEGQKSQMLTQIKQKMYSSDKSLYDDFFLGTGKLPFGAGYAVGYWIIELFLSKNSEYSWKEMLQLDAHDITIRALEEK